MLCNTKQNSVILQLKIFYIISVKYLGIISLFKNDWSSLVNEKYSSNNVLMCQFKLILIVELNDLKSQNFMTITVISLLFKCPQKSAMNHFVILRIWLQKKYKRWNISTMLLWWTLNNDTHNKKCYSWM